MYPVCLVFVLVWAVVILSCCFSRIHFASAFYVGGKLGKMKTHLCNTWNILRHRIYAQFLLLSNTKQLKQLVEFHCIIHFFIGSALASVWSGYQNLHSCYCGNFKHLHTFVSFQFQMDLFRHCIQYAILPLDATVSLAHPHFDRLQIILSIHLRFSERFAPGKKWYCLKNDSWIEYLHWCLGPGEYEP